MAVFFLTSGRTGSTAIARRLNAHPDLAVISDLFEPALAEPYFDRRARLTGDDFWALLTRPSLPERIAHWRREPTDELLFLPDDDGEVSLLMTYTLPFLAKDPWALRADLEPAVRAAPTMVASDHLLHFFDLLRRRCGAATWVERTGGSLPHAAKMIAAFPDARFVHLARNPVETALSMRTGSFFRLYLAMQSGDEARWQEPRFADPVRLAQMLNRWSVDASAAMRTLPSAQLYSFTYEQFVSNPSASLLSLLEFVRPAAVTPVDHAWAAERASDVRAAGLKAPELPAGKVAAIRATCRDAEAAWRAASR